MSKKKSIKQFLADKQSAIASDASLNFTKVNNLFNSDTEYKLILLNKSEDYLKHLIKAKLTKAEELYFHILVFGDLIHTLNIQNEKEVTAINNLENIIKKSFEETYAKTTFEILHPIYLSNVLQYKFKLVTHPSSNKEKEILGNFDDFEKIYRSFVNKKYTVTIFIEYWRIISNLRILKLKNAKYNFQDSNKYLITINNILAELPNRPTALDNFNSKPLDELVKKEILLLIPMFRLFANIISLDISDKSNSNKIKDLYEEAIKFEDKSLNQFTNDNVKHEGILLILEIKAIYYITTYNKKAFSLILEYLKNNKYLNASYNHFKYQFDLFFEGVNVTPSNKKSNLTEEQGIKLLFQNKLLYNVISIHQKGLKNTNYNECDKYIELLEKEKNKNIFLDKTNMIDLSQAELLLHKIHLIARDSSFNKIIKNQVIQILCQIRGILKTCDLQIKLNETLGAKIRLSLITNYNMGLLNPELINYTETEKLIEQAREIYDSLSLEAIILIEEQAYKLFLLLNKPERVLESLKYLHKFTKHPVYAYKLGAMYDFIGNHPIKSTWYFRIAAKDPFYRQKVKEFFGISTSTQIENNSKAKEGSTQLEPNEALNNMPSFTTVKVEEIIEEEKDVPTQKKAFIGKSNEQRSKEKNARAKAIYEKWKDSALKKLSLFSGKETKIKWTLKNGKEVFSTDENVIKIEEQNPHRLFYVYIDDKKVDSSFRDVLLKNLRITRETIQSGLKLLTLNNELWAEIKETTEDKRACGRVVKGINVETGKKSSNLAYINKVRTHGNFKS
ncbi:MAG: hypothetical protein J0H68_03990 [Sphingobacteriia bacterium]|nr:hypothetical protein [Sphingobacteriia bacterium]